MSKAKSLAEAISGQMVPNRTECMTWLKALELTPPCQHGIELAVLDLIGQRYPSAASRSR